MSGINDRKTEEEMTLREAMLALDEADRVGIIPLAEVIARFTGKESTPDPGTF